MLRSQEHLQRNQVPFPAPKSHDSELPVSFRESGVFGLVRDLHKCVYADRQVHTRD